MCITFPTVNDYIHRSNSITNYSGASTGCTWTGWFKIPALPTGSQYIPIWLMGDSRLINPYYRIFITSTGVVAEIWDGITRNTSPAVTITPQNKWIYLHHYYNKASKYIAIGRVQAQMYLLNTPTALELMPWVQNEEWIGADNSGNPNRIAGLSAYNVRTWKSAITPQFGNINMVDSYHAMDHYGMQQYSGPLRDSTFYSLTGLNDNTDLADVTTANANWISQGNPTTTISSPFALINGEFSDNFDDGTFSPWVSISRNSNVFGVGTNDTCAFACGTGQVGKTIEAPYPTAGTINMDGKFRWATTGNGEAFSALIAQSPNLNSIDQSLGNGISVRAILIQDGSIRLEVSDIGTQVKITSLLNVYPVDGTPFGYQLTWQLVGSILSADVYINAVKVVTASITSPGFSNPYYNRVFIYPSSSNALWSAWDNFKFKNVFNAYAPPGVPANMLPLAVNRCQAAKPIMTGMTINCNTHRITITGNGFTNVMQWTLSGMDNVTIPTTIVSVTPTAVILDVPTATTGKYCVSVYNPTKCAGLVTF